MSATSPPRHATSDHQRPPAATRTWLGHNNAPPAARPMTTDRLRWCLDVLGWSQNELAWQLQVDKTTSHTWARGTRPIPDEMADWIEGLTAARLARPLPHNWRNRPTTVETA